MNPKEKKFESPRKRAIRWIGMVVILVAGIVLIVAGTKTTYKVYNFKAAAGGPDGSEKNPPPELLENPDSGADDTAEESNGARSSEEIAKEFGGNLAEEPSERSSEDIAKDFASPAKETDKKSGESNAKQLGDTSKKESAAEKATERPFTMITDVQLTIDTTYSGVLLKNGELVSQYDRSKAGGKRACPT